MTEYIQLVSTPPPSFPHTEGEAYMWLLKRFTKLLSLEKFALYSTLGLPQKLVGRLFCFKLQCSWEGAHTLHAAIIL